MIEMQNLSRPYGSRWCSPNPQSSIIEFLEPFRLRYLILAYIQKFIFHVQMRIEKNITRGRINFKDADLITRCQRNSFWPWQEGCLAKSRIDSLQPPLDVHPELRVHQQGFTIGWFFSRFRWGVTYKIYTLTSVNLSKTLRAWMTLKSGEKRAASSLFRCFLSTFPAHFPANREIMIMELIQLINTTR
jgi:hypothetical protein